MHVADFRITRFQYARDRVIGDSQVRIEDLHVATLELIADSGEVGLGFILSLFHKMGLIRTKSKRWSIHQSV